MASAAVPSSVSVEVIEKDPSTTWFESCSTDGGALLARFGRAVPPRRPAVQPSVLKTNWSKGESTTREEALSEGASSRLQTECIPAPAAEVH